LENNNVSGTSASPESELKRYINIVKVKVNIET
jgi:fructose/tagatose bisphosphate aldolase